MKAVQLILGRKDLLPRFARLPLAEIGQSSVPGRDDIMHAYNVVFVDNDGQSKVLKDRVPYPDMEVVQIMRPFSVPFTVVRMQEHIQNIINLRREG